MSTRSVILLKDDCGQLLFYRHSDGYPSSVAPQLRIFLDWIKSGKIRDNIDQCAGWLVLLGHYEYVQMGKEQHSRRTSKERNAPNYVMSRYCGTVELFLSPDYDKKNDTGSNWKCGAYEPMVFTGDMKTSLPWDIEFMYELDMHKKTVRCWEHCCSEGNTDNYSMRGPEQDLKEWFTAQENPYVYVAPRTSRMKPRVNIVRTV